MKFFKNAFLPILLSAIWISISEFARNEFLVKDHWTTHYENMGLVFPAEPINGATWGLWSVLFAILIYIISRKFNLFQTTIIAWFAGFVLMWVVAGNLGFLPFGILYIAVPLSILEAFLAALIIKRLERLRDLVSNVGSIQS